MSEQNDEREQDSRPEAEAYTIHQEKDGSIKFSRRNFLNLALAAGGALLAPEFIKNMARQAQESASSSSAAQLPRIILHAGPGIDTNIIEVLKESDLVRLVHDRPDLGWVEVVSPAGNQGWLAHAFVDFARAFTPGTQGENPSGVLLQESTATPTPIIFLPLVVNGAVVPPEPTATATPRPSATPCPAYVNPCSGNRACPPVENCTLYVAPCPGNRICPPVESCILYQPPCPGNRMCPPVESCLLYHPPCPGNRICPPVESCILYRPPCPANSICPPVDTCGLYSLPCYTKCTCVSYVPPCTINCTCVAYVPPCYTKCTCVAYTPPCFTKCSFT